MARYLIDVSRLVARSLRGRIPTGIDRVGLAYIRHFGPRARAALTLGSKALILSERHSRDVFDGILGGEPERQLRRVLVAGALGSVLRPAVQQAWFLNTGHTGLHRPGYGPMLAALGVRPVYVIHDLIPISHPQYCRAPEPLRHRARMITALRSAAALVCNSSATFDELAAFAATNNLPLPPTTTALLATGTGATDTSAADRHAKDTIARAAATATAAACGITTAPPFAQPYFVMLGTIEPRKNHLLILQVWQRLVRQLGADVAPRLVLIGQQGWECEHVLRLIERAPELRNHLTWLEGCSDAELANWLSHARALLFPSFAEGFGLPVLEALENGVPVIAADLPVYREFAGDTPEYLDPLDATGWQAAIAAYSVPGDRRRQRKVEALAGFAGPSWAEHFARVEDLLTRIDERAGSEPTRRSPAGDAIRTV